MSVSSHIHEISHQLEQLRLERATYHLRARQCEDYSALGLYDRECYYPSRRALREVCADQGHHWGERRDPVTQTLTRQCVGCGTRAALEPEAA